MRRKMTVAGVVFDASAKTLDFTAIAGFSIERLYAVLNGEALIYAVGTPGAGYASLAGSVVTLEFDTTAMADNDPLTVIYDADEVGLLPTGAATAANQASVLTALATLLGYTDGIEGSLGSILAKLSGDPSTGAKQDALATQFATLLGYSDGIEGGLASILAKLSGDPATGAKQDAITSAVVATTPLVMPSKAQRVVAEGASFSYSAGILNFTPAANPTDIFALYLAQFYRSASLKRISLSGTCSSSITITAAGASHAAGDVLVMANGALVKVLTVSAGAIATAQLLKEPTSFSGGAVAQSSTTGAGTAATITFVYNQPEPEIDVLLQSSPNGGGNGNSMNIALHDPASSVAPAIAAAAYYTANRSSNGDGISNSRPVIRHGRLKFATPGSQGTPIAWDFSTRGAQGPMIKDLVKWLVLNLAGQTLPNNAKFSINVEWTEERVPRVDVVGNSLISNATELFYALGSGDTLMTQVNLLNTGSNGMRIEDYIGALNGNLYPLSSTMNRNPDVVVFHEYLVNTYRVGTVAVGDLATAGTGVYMLNQVITSLFGNNNDVKIILWGENPPLADDPTSSNAIAYGTGQFAGMTLAQAAQKMSDMLVQTIDAFASDTRLFAIVKSTDIRDTVGNLAFPQTVRTFANSPYMVDQLHPNPRGRVLKARQIAPYIQRAAAAASAFIF